MAEAASVRDQLTPPFRDMPSQALAVLGEGAGGQGHEVRRLQRGGADFELTLRQRRSVVAFKRWKAANLGVEPLRELRAAQRELDADAALLVATGVLSEKAADLVRDNPLQLLGADELVRLVRGTKAAGA